MINRNSLLVQNLMGLTLYTGVINETVIDILSVFGVSCSMSKINDKTKYWVKQRQAITEIDQTKMLRVSIDNLNFKRKYAKTVKTGGHVDGRMLNLITSQVTHRKEN